MKKDISLSVEKELWLIRLSRKVGINSGEQLSYAALKEWLSSCEDEAIAMQVVDNAMLCSVPTYKLQACLRLFENDYRLVKQRIISDAIPEDKPSMVPQDKAKGKREKRITGNGP